MDRLICTTVPELRSHKLQGGGRLVTPATDSTTTSQILFTRSSVIFPCLVSYHHHHRNGVRTSLRIRAIRNVLPSWRQTTKDYEINTDPDSCRSKLAWSCRVFWENLGVLHSVQVGIKPIRFEGIYWKCTNASTCFTICICIDLGILTMITNFRFKIANVVILIS